MRLEVRCEQEYEESIIGQLESSEERLRKVIKLAAYYELPPNVDRIEIEVESPMKPARLIISYRSVRMSYSFSIPKLSNPVQLEGMPLSRLPEVLERSFFLWGEELVVTERERFIVVYEDYALERHVQVGRLVVAVPNTNEWIKLPRGVSVRVDALSDFVKVLTGTDLRRVGGGWRESIQTVMQSLDVDTIRLLLKPFANKVLPLDRLMRKQSIRRYLEGTPEVMLILHNLLSSLER